MFHGQIKFLLKITFIAWEQMVHCKHWNCYPNSCLSELDPKYLILLMCGLRLGEGE
jgi:hypothetical protein